MIRTIAIVGAGQLGCRHLQGLKNAKTQFAIQVVDPNPAALRVAQQRYDEIPQREECAVHDLELLQSIDQLNNTLDIVIVATNSIPRSQIVLETLEKKTVRNLILEKFLFPDYTQYSLVESALIRSKLQNNTWVNCPRRLFEGFKRLKNDVVNSSCIDLVIVGWNWGLACNVIHFLDLFDHLLPKEDSIKNIDLSCLKNDILQSKRAGYIEILGTVLATSENGSSATISCFEGAQKHFISTLYTETSKYDILQNKDCILKDGCFFSKISSLYQSEITGEIVDSILGVGSCSLTPYIKSERIHLQFLFPLINFYNQRIQSSGTFVPIT